MMKYCPLCRSTRIHQSRRKGIIERILLLIFVRPFRCERCDARFFRISLLSKPNAHRPASTYRLTRGDPRIADIRKHNRRVLILAGYFETKIVTHSCSIARIASALLANGIGITASPRAETRCPLELRYQGPSQRM